MATTADYATGRGIRREDWGAPHRPLRRVVCVIAYGPDEREETLTLRRDAALLGDGPELRALSVFRAMATLRHGDAWYFVRLDEADE